MFKKTAVLSLVVVLLTAACGAAPQEQTLPTLAASVGETPTPEGAIEARATASGDVADLTLGQVVESETGVTYQLPATWFINDNDSVSNFASDEDAVLDYMDMDAELNSRWIVLGSVGTSTPDEVTGLDTAASFEEAAALLHAYYYTADADIQPPMTVTLSNGTVASMSLGNNPNMEGKAVAVYFVDAGNGTFINIFFEARLDVMEEIATLRDAVVSSVVLR